MPRLYGLGGIDGLDLWSDFVTQDEEQELLKRTAVVARPDRLVTVVHHLIERSRVERYGVPVYEMDHTSDTIPPYLDTLCGRLLGAGCVAKRPNSVSINEYNTGHGLPFHVDRGRDDVCVLGLGATARLAWQGGWRVGLEPIVTSMPPRSLLLLRGDARRRWQHSVLPVEARRISLVFRYGEVGTGATATTG